MLLQKLPIKLIALYKSNEQEILTNRWQSMCNLVQNQKLGLPPDVTWQELQLPIQPKYALNVHAGFALLWIMTSNPVLFILGGISFPFALVFTAIWLVQHIQGIFT